MYLIPLIRVNRALASVFLYPEHPIQSIAVSEMVSVFGPFLNPKMYSKIIAVTAMLMYIPHHSHYILNYFSKINEKYYQAEICSILLFVLTVGLDKI